MNGLDEYVGKLSEITQIFKKPTASKTVKICISSRAWNVF
jgi:hypothetical protein